MEQPPPKPFVLIDIRTKTSFVEVLYGENADDPAPFILVVSPQYVARKTFRALPINIVYIQDYVMKHADSVLKEIAIIRRDAGYTAHSL